MQTCEDENELNVTSRRNFRSGDGQQTFLSNDSFRTCLRFPNGHFTTSDKWRKKEAALCPKIKTMINDEKKMLFERIKTMSSDNYCRGKI
jgi:ssDNA-binding Zn-finger/Zn-ribbon topoisomerase 1